MKLNSEDNGNRKFIMCCLDNDIDVEMTEKMLNPIKEFEDDYGLENMRVVFRDGSFANSVVKTNVLTILKQNSIDEVGSM